MIKPSEWLRKKLEASGMSQRRLTEMLDLEPARLNKWLMGTERITEEFALLLREPLNATTEEMAELRGLIDISRWQDKIRRRLAEPPFSKGSEVGARLYGHMAGYAEDLAAQDTQLDGELPFYEHCVKHLWAVHVVLRSAVRALSPSGDLLFSAENISAHLKYPTNYHLARLLAFRDEKLTAASDIAKELCEHVIRLFDDTAGDSFTDRLIRQHSAHLRVRLGLDGPDSLAFRKLVASGDVQDQRMVLFGKALSAGATDGDWERVFDRLNGEEGFRKATAVFDSYHYGHFPLNREWPVFAPTVRAALVRALIGLSAPDEHHRLFAAQRLRALLGYAHQEDAKSPSVVAHVKRLQERGTDRGLPTDLRDTFQTLAKTSLVRDN